MPIYVLEQDKIIKALYLDEHKDAIAIYQELEYEKGIPSELEYFTADNKRLLDFHAVKAYINV